jgi:alkylhydroperoxidase family enzyme
MLDPSTLQHFRGLRPHTFLARLAEESVIGPAFERFGRALVDELDGRTLELVALRVAARRDCLYVWRAHSYIGLEHLSEQEIARVAYDPSVLRGTDALVVRAVDELLNQSLSRSARAALGSRALRVTLAAGFYDTVATLMADVEPERDVPVVPGLETPSIAARRAAREAQALV